MKKKLVNEIFWLRAIACLAVVTIHSIQKGIDYYFTGENTPMVYFLHLFYAASLFGTPSFVFISEFLLAKAYPSGVPQGFFKKRVKFLITPFIFMGIVYAFFELGTSITLKSFIIEVLKNILIGDYVAWFILLILQFYLLHMFAPKYLSKISPKVVLPIALAINVLYLSFFEFIDPIQAIPFHDYIWDRGYWLLFIGWIFYFALGYYIGKDFESFKLSLQKNGKLILVFTVIAYCMVVGLKLTGILPDSSSKRPDIPIYTTAIICLIFYLSGKLNHAPRLIILISNYSFNIYLLHMTFLYTIKPLPHMNMITYTLFLLILSVTCSIVLATLINKLTFGKYLVGNTLSVGKQTKGNMSIANKKAL
ncbi:acyltransferase family protein [Priestia megaterium]|uniref:acyltransferase family protein n=1 Tax=Priestia megaterium TaxID=1404 RepID=UPI002280CFF8|nr:acyltransferase family protein [Priestia megaterium]MCY9018877.1 acyltransferase family protein [Priestia megaterium]